MRPGRVLFGLLLLAGVAFVGWKVRERLAEDEAPTRGERERRPAPVEVVAVQRGRLESARTFTGTLEAPEKFVVAPKVRGRVERVALHAADEVERGQVVVELDDAEFRQEIRRAEADLAVARANLAEAESVLAIARRGLERIQTLSGRGVASDVQLDAAQAEETAKRAQVDVAAAQVERAEALLEAARIQLGYTIIHAEWSGGADRRVVSARYVDPGDTVSPGAPLLEVLEVDELLAVVFVSERDYGRIAVGQSVSLSADAFPEETFTGTVDRIAPTFRRDTRQARVEIAVANEAGRLKPGMFVRARVVLESVDDTPLVPETALVNRQDTTGVFVLPDGADAVEWFPVQVGIRTGDLVQLVGPVPEGRVVTLGHQLLGDGSRVVVPEVPGADDAPGPDEASE